MTRKLDEKYRHAAAEFARRVARALGDEVDAIVLYGSVARGEATEDSDIDILVVGSQPKTCWEKVSEICSNYTYEQNYSFFISLARMGRKELAWHTRVRSPFIHNVFEEGVILYDNGTFSRIRAETTPTSR